MKSRPEIGSASSGSRTNDRGQMSRGQSTTRTTTVKPAQFGGDWFNQALNKKQSAATCAVSLLAPSEYRERTAQRSWPFIASSVHL